MHTYLDTKTIIINVMKAQNEIWIHIEDLQEIMIVIKEELEKQGKLDNYHIWYVEDFYSIERSVSFNNDIFEMSEDTQQILLRKKEMLDVLADNYQIDKTITAIIQNYINNKKEG